MAYFTREVNQSRAKPSLEYNGGPAKCQLTALIE